MSARFSAPRKSWACWTEPGKVWMPSNPGTLGKLKWPVATMMRSNSEVVVRPERRFSTVTVKLSWSRS